VGVLAGIPIGGWIVSAGIFFVTTIGRLPASPTIIIAKFWRALSGSLGFCPCGVYFTAKFAGILKRFFLLRM
jgi:hypothetical protein